MTRPPGVDYADRFALTLAAPDAHTAGEWARAGIDAGPAIGQRIVVGIHRVVLRLRLLAPDAPGQLIGWRIAEETDHSIVLVAGGPLLDGRLVVSRPSSRDAEMRTTVVYRGRRAGMVWALVQPLHRATSALLIRLAARRLGVRVEGRMRVEVSRRWRSRR